MPRLTAPIYDDFEETPAPEPPALLPDRRRFKRHRLDLPGRFMRSGKDEHSCRMRDVSIGGICLASATAIEIGEPIIAYFDVVGGVEGTVIRRFEGGFVMQLSASTHKREKLAAQITWLLNRQAPTDTDERRHERLPGEKSAQLKIGDAMSVPVRVFDVSISGASVATQARPPIGSEVTLGRLKARVVRYHPEGLGLEFTDIQRPEAVRRYFR